MQSKSTSVLQCYGPLIFLHINLVSDTFCPRLYLRTSLNDFYQYVSTVTHTPGDTLDQNSNLDGSKKKFRIYIKDKHQLVKDIFFLAVDIICQIMKNMFY